MGESASANICTGVSGELVLLHLLNCIKFQKDTDIRRREVWISIFNQFSKCLE
jgi:hypothetical protein